MMRQDQDWAPPAVGGLTGAFLITQVALYHVHVHVHVHTR